MEGLTTQAEYRGLLDNIGKLLEEAKGRVAYSVNTVLVQTYWTIGRYIVEFEQEGKERAEYGSMLLASLSRDITLRYGRGFNRNNLQYMRKFFLVFQNCTTASCNSADDPNRPTVSCNLSWSHYIELLKGTTLFGITISGHYLWANALSLFWDCSITIRNPVNVSRYLTTLAPLLANTSTRSEVSRSSGTSMEKYPSSSVTATLFLEGLSAFTTTIFMPTTGFPSLSET